MHIVDAIKALKGGLATEKEAHMTTMIERDKALELFTPWQRRAEKAEAELAAAAQELGVEYPAGEAWAGPKGK